MRPDEPLAEGLSDDDMHEDDGEDYTIFSVTGVDLQSLPISFDQIKLAISNLATQIRDGTQIEGPQQAQVANDDLLRQQQMAVQALFQQMMPGGVPGEGLPAEGRPGDNAPMQAQNNF